MQGIETGGGRGRAPRKPPKELQVGPLAPRPTGVFAQPPSRGDTGMDRAQRVAQQRVDRAQQRLPQRALPAVPTLARPTAAQDSKTIALFHRSLQRGGRNDAAVYADPRNRKALGEYQAARARQDARATGGAIKALVARGLSPQQAAQLIASHVSEGRPYTAPKRMVGIGPAMVNIAPAATGLSRFLAANTSLGTGDAPTRLVRNLGKDAVALGSAPLVGGLAVGNAAYQAGVHGDTSAAKDLGAGILHGLSQDPLVLLAQGRGREAGQSFSDHPGFGLLDAAAALGVAGRVGGAVARGTGSTAAAGGVRGALARVGSTARSPLGLSNDAGAVRGGLVHERQGSRSLAAKGVQAVVDSVRHPVVDAQGNVVTVQRGGRQVPVLQTSPRTRERLLRKSADFAASRANSVERLVRDQAAREMHARGIRGKARDLVSMVVEGTITSAPHIRRDLQAEEHRIAGKLLEHQHTGQVYRHTGEVKAAEARLATVRSALANPKVLARADRIVNAGQDIGRALNAREAEAIRLGILHPTRAGRSRLVVPAVAHMDARHHSAEELQQMAAQTVAPVRAAAKSAKVAHGGAVDAVKKAHTNLERTRAAIRVRRQQRRAEIVPPGARTGATRAQRVSAYVDAAANHPRARQMAAAEARDARLLAKRQAAVKAAVAAERAARQQRKAAEHAASLLPTGLTAKALEHGALRHADGRYLSNAEVEAALRASGRDPATVAYLPHRMDVRGARAFHTQFRPSRGMIDKPGTRTGSAYAKGVTEASIDLAREQNTRLATQTAKAGQVDRLITDQGLKHPSGRLLTPREARELADRLEKDTGERFVPVTAVPTRAGKKVEAAARAQQDPNALESLHLKLLNRRIDAAKKGDRKTVVLMPAATIERLQAHLAPANGVERFLQYANRAFRLSVLPQPRWLTGNFVEPFLVRLPVAGSGLTNIPGMGLDILATRRIVKRLERSGDPKMRQAAKEIRGQQLGGLFVGGRGATVRRTADDLPGVLKAGAVVRHLPVVKQMTDLVGGLLNGYFRLNRMIESTAQHAALGRLARHEIQDFTGSWWQTVRLGQKAVDEAAKGLVNTRTQARFMRAQHEMLGKYEGFSPTMRRLIQGPFPFLPWSMAAARFVYWTMPLKHPVVTATLVKSWQTVQPQWDEAHKDAPPGGLQAALRTKDGGFVDVGRYTPYGFSQPVAAGQLGGLTSTLLPELSGAAKALEGLDPFGKPLKVKPTAANPKGVPSGGQKALIAGNALAEALVPLLATARRLQEHGGTAFANSTVVSPKVKPDTSHGMSAARRTFDPFRPTYLKKKGGGGQFDFRSAKGGAVSQSFDFSTAK